MKLCHILPYFYPYYAGPYEYIRVLLEEGHQVDLICFQRSSDPMIESRERLSIYRVSTNNHQRLSSQDRFNLSSKALTHIAENSFDLVHVYAFRNCFILPFFGKKYVKNWIYDLRTGSVSSNQVLANISNKLSALENRFFTASISLDPNVGNKVLGQNRVFHVVPLGVDLQRFRPISSKIAIRAKLNLPATARVVVYVGSLVPSRQPENLLNAFAIAAKKHKDIMLMLVGDDSAIPHLQSQTQSLNIMERVLLPGRIPYDQIQNYIAAADIGIAYVPHTPQYRYQPPLKTVEFLACGLPTIATNTEGNTTFIQDGYNGLLSSDDVNALGNALCKLLDDPKLFERLQSNARYSVMNHDWRDIVKQCLLPLYEKIVYASVG